MAEGSPGIALELSDEASAKAFEIFEQLFKGNEALQINQRAEQILKNIPTTEIAFEKPSLVHF